MKATKRVMVLVSMLFIAISLSAQPMDGRGPGGPGSGPGFEGEGMRHHRIWEQLNLTEDQRVEIKKLHEEMKPVRIEHHKAMKAVRDKIEAEIQKENSDRATLTNYSREMAELHFKQAEAMADHLLKIKAILTPEQFKKMQELHDQRRGGKGHGKGKGPGKGHGNGSGHCTE